VQDAAASARGGERSATAAAAAASSSTAAAATTATSSLAQPFIAVGSSSRGRAPSEFFASLELRHVRVVEILRPPVLILTSRDG